MRDLKSELQKLFSRAPQAADGTKESRATQPTVVRTAEQPRIVAPSAPPRPAPMQQASRSPASHPPAGHPVAASIQPVIEPPRRRGQDVRAQRLHGPFKGQLPAMPLKPGRAVETLNVGLDFGTSTTKVCVRQSLGLSAKTPIWVLGLGETVQRSPVLLCPSVIAVENGRLWFGEEARTRASSAMMLSHLKVCLAAQAEDRHAKHDCHNGKAGIAASCDGVFELLGGSGASLLASEAVTLFLAWAMGQARKRAQALRPTFASYGVNYNLGVPLDHVDAAPELRSTYERVAYGAWRLSQGVEQGLPVETALAWLGELDANTDQALSDRPVQLCAEADAALVAWVSAPTTASGVYGLVDIGAWTTDISFFRFNREARTGGSGRVAHYGARSCRVAAREIDHRLGRVARELWDLPDDFVLPAELSAANLESRRESNELADREFLVGVHHRILSETALRFSRECVRERLVAQFQTALKTASEKERSERAFAGMVIYVMGGGAHEDMLWRGIAKHWPVELLPVRYQPTNLDAALFERVGRRFSVSIGLAFPTPVWHESLEPSRVAPLGPERGRRDLPTFDELGYAK